MTLLLVILTLAGVAIVLTRPFRVAATAVVEARRELEQAKRAKYGELRELELDWRTGQLTDADYPAHPQRASTRGGRAPSRIALSSAVRHRARSDPRGRC